MKNLLKKSKEPSWFFAMHWQFLRDFFNLSVLKFFIAWFAIVPIFLTLTSNLPQQIQLHFGVEVYTINLQLPFKWELLWISSVLYIVAFVLTALARPSFVKKYPDYRNYADAGHSPRWIIWEIFYALENRKNSKKFIERLIKKNRAVELSPEEVLKKEFELPSKNEAVVKVFENQTSLIFEHSKKYYLSTMGENFDQAENFVKDTFWEVFGHYARSKPILRVTICIFLTCSIILFGSAVLHNILSGSMFVIR